MNNWEINKLKRFAIKIGSGITPRGGEKVYLMKGIPLIRSQNVLVNKLEMNDVAYISEEQHAKMKSSKVLFEDVLLNITGASIGRCCVVPNKIKEANVNQHVCIIRLNGQLDSKYLANFINSYLGQKQIWSFQSGGSREGLNYNQIGNFKLPVPPLPEQKAIASLLSVWDEAIEKTERLIEAKEKKFKWLRIKLIKKAINHFSSHYVQLGNILNYEQPTKYIVESTDYKENGKFPVLTANKSFILGYTEEIEGVFTDVPVIIFDDFTTDKKFVDFKFKVKSSAMKILYPKSKGIDLFYVFNTMSLIKSPNGEHKRHWISEYQFNSIPLPKYEQQQKISEILTFAQNEIDYLKELNEKYKTQKRGLMKKLLTGKWRVMYKFKNSKEVF